MPRYIICLTFDFDVVSIPIARGQTTPTALSRGEFGLVGADRLLDLLAARGLPTTLFIRGHTLESFPAPCARIHAAGHELGYHGWTHRQPAALAPVEEEQELLRANSAIEAVTGRKARGYRSPAWNISAANLDLLITYSFTYDSSIMGHDYLPCFARRGDQPPLLDSFVFGAPTDLLEMPVSWSLDNYPHLGYGVTQAGILPGLSAAGGVLQNWIDDFDYMAETRDWGVVTYTFHPFVIGRGHRMKILARLLDHLSAKGAIFMTMEAAAAGSRTHLTEPTSDA